MLASCLLLLFLLFFDFLFESFAEHPAGIFDVGSHALVAGCVHGRITKAAHHFDQETLHVDHLHLFRPEVNFERTIVVMIPDRNSNGAGIAKALVRIVGSFPVNFFGNILII